LWTALTRSARPLRRAKISLLTRRLTVVLQFATSPGNAAILVAATTQQPTGFAAPPATFYNAQVALGGVAASSGTGFVAVNGGIVRVRLTLDPVGNTLPPLQLSWQYASNLATQPGFFFVNAAAIDVVPDKFGLPTAKALIALIP